MVAFQRFEEINAKSEIIEKHREWLKDYEGKIYSIADNGIHRIKWATEKKKYRDKQFDVNINCIGELKNRCRIEFDDKDYQGKKHKEKIKLNIQEVIKTLKSRGWGYIKSSHNGSSDYLWVEFTRNLTDKEKEAFLLWIAPKDSEIDLNFASSNKVYPVLYAGHWKYPYERELPIEYFLGEKIDYDSLKLNPKESKKSKIKTIDQNGFQYKTAYKGTQEEENLPLTFEEIEQLKKDLLDLHNEIILFLKSYIELREEYYSLIALWIIGTYIHRKFETFPFLFINAMRGSGKTRLLKIIAHLAYEGRGKVQTGVNETILFRSRLGSTLLLDECESIGSKEKAILREYLNAAYKKGATVSRARKVHTEEGETFEIEEFEPYRPIAMANIWGMEEVLEDRCITIILEKSNNPKYTLKIEDFNTNPKIKSINDTISRLKCRLWRVVHQKVIDREWNNFVESCYDDVDCTTNYTTTHTTHTTNITQTTQQLCEHFDLFNKIKTTNIDGRNLELSFVIFIIANFISEEILDKTLVFFKEIMSSKREDEISTSRDVQLYDFISQECNEKYFVQVMTLTTQFRSFIKEDSPEDWINPKWMGKALKRLNLVLEKHRTNAGREVRVNVPKAQEKIKIFQQKREI